jgi:deoxyribodipyrimidine photo-lyase
MGNNMHQYNKTLYLFRRDLRLDDNSALLAASSGSKEVIPCFIFDPIQIEAQNKYRSLNAIQFMIESLKDLEQQISNHDGKLYLFYGKTIKVLEKLITENDIEALIFNKDYTPFSIKRDRAIATLCKKLNVNCISYDDALLNPPQRVLNKSKKPYTVFTPYWRTASLSPVIKPSKYQYKNLCNKKIKEAESHDIFKSILPKKNSDIAQNGGRTEALVILKHLDDFKHYEKTHDIPSKHTTELSAHIKFGTVSIREVYYALLEKLGRSAHQGLIRQLYWHDFYYQIAFHWSAVFGAPFQEKYSKIKWSYSKDHFKRWCEGITGIPIVDAGMRQLNKTGFMHNRVRMIVASFLTKDLLIDWQWGERYFAQHLVDYDPCVNNGNWQWAASTGCDPQPYFRIFNPWLQQKKFDPECIYIKEWVEELRNIDPKIIHNWHKEQRSAVQYPEPMVDHAIQKDLALKMFRACK